MAKYGPKGRDPERLPDWLLGGARRRRVFERLNEEGGWNAQGLADDIQSGPAWVFEIFRILKAADALEQTTRGHYRLATGHELADSMRHLIDALGPYSGLVVERPPSRRARAAKGTKRRRKRD